jgi:LysM repeat protein
MRIRLFIIALLTVLVFAPFTLASASPSAQSACGPGVTHLVRRGENLFRISLRYGTTMGVIAQANGIGNYALIYAGQRLTIPCAGGAVPPAPTTPQARPQQVYPYPGRAQFYDPPPEDSNGILPPVYGSPSYYIPPIQVDCTQLVATSPLQGMFYGNNTFYWNAMPGATSYRVNVYSVDVNPGTLVASFDTPATHTSLVGEIGGNAGHGYRFAWEVEGLVSDIPVCQTRRFSMRREAP